MTQIKKAVFPVAGLGTRFLPATKANPKEMLPVVDKPLIQYAVEEAVASGIEQLIFVTSANKRAIEDHFDRNLELENQLANSDKQSLLAQVKNIIPEHVDCVYIRQAEQKGLGHAILCAKQIVGNEPFAVLLADDLIKGQTASCLAQMIDVYKRTQSSVLAVEEVPTVDIHKYGVIEPELIQADVRIRSIVEKPQAEDAPSNLAVVGRYILHPSIFPVLETIQPGKGGEIQLTDAIANEIEHGHVYYGLPFKGKRFDCGSKLGFLQATVEYGLAHQECADAFSSYLQKRLSLT